jgi:hypothetical protein
MKLYSAHSRWPLAITSLLAALGNMPLAAQTTMSMPPTLHYDSAFKQYQPWREEKLEDWQTANQTVMRIGGWREYAKQAEAAKEAPVAKPTPQTERSKP